MDQNRPQPRPRRRQTDSGWALRGQTSWDALALLPADLQQVLRLRFIEDRPVTEIARLMEESPARVKSMQARALRMLRDHKARQSARDDLGDPAP